VTLEQVEPSVPQGQCVSVRRDAERAGRSAEPLGTLTRGDVSARGRIRTCDSWLPERIRRG